MPLCRPSAELERVRRALAEREGQLALCIAHSPAPIAMLDREMRYLAASRCWCEAYGADADAIVGRCHYDVFPTIPPRWREVHRRCLAGAVERCEQDRFVRADGRVDTLRWEVRPWRRGTGEIGGIVLFTEVITDRVEAQAALAASEERLRLAVAAANLGTWHWDLGSGRLVWSARCHEIFGVPPGAALRYADFLAAVHREDRERVAAAVERAVGEGAPYDVELRVVRPDGGVRWAAAWGRVFVDPGGLPARMEGVVLDITRRKELEEELRQAQKMEAIGQLAGGVAHDFNNLLTVILCQAASLTGPEVAPEVTESARGIVEAAERAGDLTGQLLAFARRQVLQVRPVDLDEVVAGAVKMLRRILPEGIEVALRPAGAPVIVRADPTMLTQVVLNLALNARDAMPRGGHLEIETAIVAAGDPARAWARLAVRDDGSGIAPEHLPAIFEPFYTTKARGRGTGLGLATVDGIVKQHGGWIDVDTAPGAGSTFRVHLPLDGGVADGPEAPDGPGAPRGRGETVLLVEDEEAVRGAVQAILEGHGYRVLAADHAAQALAVAVTRGPEIDLLVTDMIMPGGMTGAELARRLRAERPGLRVIVTTGYSPEDIGDLLAEEGVSAFAKPHTPALLLRAVHEALAGRRA